MTQYIIDALQVDIDEANRLRTGYTQRYGAALLGLTRHHPLDRERLPEGRAHFPDLGSMIRHERGIARLVAALPGRKIVLTNAPEAYARAVLAELRIERLFEQVIAIEHMRDRRRWRAKPDHAMLRKAMRDAHVVARRRDPGRRHALASEELPAAWHPHGVDHRTSAAQAARGRRADAFAGHRPAALCRPEHSFVKIATTGQPLGSMEGTAAGTTAMQPIDKPDEALAEHEPTAPAAHRASA